MDSSIRAGVTRSATAIDLAQFRHPYDEILQVAPARGF
jgi:hypothetical protein